MTESRCEACDTIVAIGVPDAVQTYITLLVRAHHSSFRAEKERADRLAETEATTARALGTALAERDAARKEIEALRREIDERRKWMYVGPRPSRQAARIARYAHEQKEKP